jgi:CobB/CobQ-like glutamine amidotransferase domain
VVQTDPVLVRARAFLDALMPILDESCRGASDAPIVLPIKTWVPELDLGFHRRFRAVAKEFSANQQCAARMLGELRAQGEPMFLDLEEALEVDTVIGPRLRAASVTRAGAGGRTWQAPALRQDLVDQAVSHAPDFRLDVAAREKVTAQWVTALRRPSDRITVIAALREFEAPGAPITVEPDQMLGTEIVDTAGVDGTRAGLGLLAVSTTFAASKATRVTATVFASELPAPWRELAGTTVEGYQIRHGNSEIVGPTTGALPDGLGFASGSVLGVYLHGLFEQPALSRALVGSAATTTLDVTFERLADCRRLCFRQRAT